MAEWYVRRMSYHNPGFRLWDKPEWRIRYDVESPHVTGKCQYEEPLDGPYGEHDPAQAAAYIFERVRTWDGAPAFKAATGNLGCETAHDDPSDVLGLLSAKAAA